METIVSFYGKGNEIIFWHSFYVGLSLVLSDNYYCVCCDCWSMLHQICTNWIGNDNIHQCSKTISSDDNIHSSLCMVGDKVGNLFLYMSSTL
jgi:hypothetical protein